MIVQHYKIAPCPFCESRNVEVSDETRVVSCFHCGAVGPASENMGTDGAVKLWNEAGKEPHWIAGNTTPEQWAAVALQAVKLAKKLAATQENMLLKLFEDDTKCVTQK